MRPDFGMLAAAVFYRSLKKMTVLTNFQAAAKKNSVGKQEGDPTLVSACGGGGQERGEEGIGSGVSNHRGREAQEHRSSGSEAGSEAVVGCGPHQGRTCAQHEGG